MSLKMQTVNPQTSFSWSQPLDINGVPMLGVKEKQGTYFMRKSYLLYKLGLIADPDRNGMVERAKLRPQSRPVLSAAREAYRQGITPDFPPYFIIEPVGGICNRKCPFCSIGEVKKTRKGMLAWEHFKKLMDECGQHSVYGLSLYQLGESFLYKSESSKNESHEAYDIADMVNYAKHPGGFQVVNLSTNGDVDNLEVALECDLDDLIFSIDGLTAKTYLENRVPTKKGDVEAFGRTIERVLTFLSKKVAKEAAAQRVHKPYVRVQIINNASTRDEILDFIRYWIAVSGVDDVYVKELDAMAPWVGEKAVSKAEADLKLADVADIPCQHLWAVGSMTADGVLSACCHDARSELTDQTHIKDGSFYDWWHGKYMTEMREKHEHLHLEGLPCTGCHERDCWIGNVTLGQAESAVLPEVQLVDAISH